MYVPKTSRPQPFLHHGPVWSSPHIMQRGLDGGVCVVCVVCVEISVFECLPRKEPYTFDYYYICMYV